MNIPSFKLILFTLIAGCVLASCKDKTESSSEVITYNLTLTADNPSESGDAATEGWNWKSGDQIKCINLTYTRSTTTLSYNGSTFTGTVPSAESSAKLGFVYPTSAAPQTASDTSYVRIDITQQDGVNATRYMAGTCASTVSGTTATASVTMKIINAIANLSLNYNGEPIKNISHIEVYSDKGSMNNRGDYELKTLSFNNTYTGNVAVNNTDGLNGKASIALFPANGVRLCVSAVTTDGTVYTASQEKSFNIVAGEVYNITYNCSRNDSKAHIGDYFYSDLTYSTEYNELKTCVGIVFALSDQRGGDINNSLTESTHGRVMALADGVKSNWSLSATYATDMPALTNYTTADASNQYGYLPFHVEGGTMGYYSEADVKITAALDATGHMASWPTSGALSDFDGYTNSTSINKNSSTYPAGYYAAHYTKSSGGITTWYLPSIGEMALMYALHRSGIIRDQEGLVALSEFSYWTSSEHSAEKAWVMQAFDGKVYPNFKTSLYCIRPAMQF